MTTTLNALLQRAAHRRAIRDLMKLDDRLLRDIGLTRTELGFMITQRGPNAGSRDA